MRAVVQFHLRQALGSTRPLPDANTRYCGECQRAVHKVTTPQEFDAAQAAHHCIAWVRPKAGADDGPAFLAGDVAQDWKLE